MKINEKLVGVGAAILLSLSACIALVSGGSSEDAALDAIATVPVMRVDRDGTSSVLPFTVLGNVVIARDEWTVREILPGTSFRGRDMVLVKLRTADGKSTLIVPVSQKIRRAEGLSAGDQVTAKATVDRVSFRKDGVPIAYVRDGTRAP